MKLKAKYKWNGEEVMVKPVYFSWHVGLQYKTLTGYSAASIFCNKESEYVFPLKPNSFYSLSKYGIGCVIGYGCR